MSLSLGVRNCLKIKFMISEIYCSQATSGYGVRRFFSAFNQNRYLVSDFNCKMYQSNRLNLFKVPYPLINMKNCFGSKKKEVETPPIDYLPFTYERPPPTDYFANSGDVERTIVVDETLPKPGFEHSEALKQADEKVKKILTLSTSTKIDKFVIKREQILEKVRQHPLDTTSPEVQIALRTLQVRKHFEHVYSGKRQRRGLAKVLLLNAINRRNKMLKLLKRVDCQRFYWLIKQLNITYNPPMLSVKKLKYLPYDAIRKATKEYCEKLKEDKIAAHHKELKRQQELFVKEKEEILAWIAKEEKALGLETPGDGNLISMHKF